MRGRLSPQALSEHSGEDAEDDLRKPVDALGHAEGIVHLRRDRGCRPSLTRAEQE
jgi:hypothetical protein